MTEPTYVVEDVAKEIAERIERGRALMAGLDYVLHCNEQRRAISGDHPIFPVETPCHR